MLRLNKLLVITGIAILILCVIPSFTAVSNAVDADGDLVIVIDPGHGGVDPGAVNSGKGLLEKNLNLRIAEVFEQELETYANVKVYLTHYSIPSNQELSVRDRGEIAKYYNADRFFSVHNNAGGNKGAEVYVTRMTTRLEYKQESTVLGNKFLAKYSALGIVNRGIRTRDSQDYVYTVNGNGQVSGILTSNNPGQTADWYGAIRYPMGYGIPGILLEHAYMDSTDVQFLDSDADLIALGKADAKAVAEYYGLYKRTSYIGIDKPESGDYVDRKIKVSGWGTGSKANRIDIYVDDQLVASNVTRTAREDIHTQYPGYRTSTPNPGFEYELDTTKLSDGPHRIKAQLVTNDGEKYTKSRDIYVDNSAVVSGVRLNIDKAIVEKDKTLTLKPTIYPDTAENLRVDWSIDNSQIATINSSTGVITAIAEGNAVITATTKDGGFKATCSITVKPALQAGQFITFNTPLKQSEVYIAGINMTDYTQNTVQNIKAKISASPDLTVQITDDNGQTLANDAIIGTGCKVVIKEGSTIIREYNIIIYGDVDGDGDITSIDMLVLQRYLLQLNNSQLSYPKLTAANTSKDLEEPSSVDMLRIQRHALDIKYLVQ